MVRDNNNRLRGIVHARLNATSFPGPLLGPWDLKRRDPGNEVGLNGESN